jgi:hypothetical protein
MSAGTLLLALAPYGAALLLALLLLVEIARMLVGRRHPVRILVHVLTCGFYLLLVGLLVPIGGVLTVIWWVFVALPLIAAAVALARSRVAAAMAGGAGAGTARTDEVEVGTARGDEAEADTARTAAVVPAVDRTRRRRLRRATRPSVPELVTTVVLFAAAAILWLLAG